MDLQWDFPAECNGNITEPRCGLTSFNKQESLNTSNAPQCYMCSWWGEGDLWGGRDAYKDIGVDLSLRGPSIGGGRFRVEVGLKV